MSGAGLRYGLIGCGMMGREHLRNIALLNGVEAAALYDPVPALAEQALQDAPGAGIVPSFEALIARQDLDALVIASPNDLHLPQIEQIAARNPLPLLVEKPLYTHPEERARVTALERHYRAPIWVAMEYRYMPAVAQFIERAPSVCGQLRMLTIREHRFPFLEKVGGWNRFNSRTGGTLVEKCCHFFDLMAFILQAEPVRVMASGGQAVNHLEERHGEDVPDIWDHAYVITDFANGARAMLDLCMFAEGSRYQEELCALGARGKIEALVPGPGRFWPAHLGTPPVAQIVESPRSPKGPSVQDVPVDPSLLAAGDHNGATFYQHQKFRDVVRGQGQVEVTLAHGVRAVALGLAAQHAASTGQAINLT